ncbi:MAG: amino acid permease [Thermoguttaceae bacterium]
MPLPFHADGPGAAAPRRELTLFDSICVIVGIIVGAGIYQSSPLIASCLPSTAALIGIWLLGGFLSLVGAACYAELATAYPQDGGDYVYLTRGLGRPVGFLCAWSQLWIVRPGSIGALAFVFAGHFKELIPVAQGTGHTLLYAAGAIVVLTAINILSVREGKWTQNILTSLKLLGLVIIGVAAFLPTAASASAPVIASHQNLSLALILVLFTYGGWNEMGYVAAEVRRPEKNLLRALMLGTAAVTLIYVLLNVAFVHSLGFAGTQSSQVIAADVVNRAAPGWGGKAIAALICISALSAVNGMIFTGSRITYAMGTEHPLWAALGRWNARHGTPICSLVAQALVTLALAVGFGLREGAFDRMVMFTTPVAWLFFTLVGVSLFILRFRDPLARRPYRVTAYPFTPLLFCLSSLYLVYSSLSYAWENKSPEALWSIGILLVGFVFVLFDRDHRPKS